MSGPLQALAQRYEMEPSRLDATLRSTVVPAGVSDEQMLVFAAVANEYGLNPLTKEIYAFPARNGGIQPIVSIDGWLKIINSHPQFDGMEFEDVREDGQLVAVTCRIHRKDRSHPVAVTEYMDECRRNTDTWKKWPARMLRHKAAIQAARYAFGLSGIIDPDEAERHQEAGAIEAEVVPTLDDALAAIERCTSTAEMREQAAPICAQLTGDDLEQARKAYGERYNTLQEAENAAAQ